MNSSIGAQKKQIRRLRAVSSNFRIINFIKEYTWASAVSSSEIVFSETLKSIVKV